MTQLNIWVEYEFCTVHHSIPGRYHCSLLKSFADWPNRTRLPCVHSLCNSVCQAPRCSSTMMFSMSSLVRATCRGALAISNTFNKNCDRMESSWDLCPMIWRIQKRRQRCRRRLLKSAPSVSLCICQTSSPFISSLGGLKFRDLLAPASRGSCFDVSFLKFCSKTRSSVPPEPGFLRCCELCTFPFSSENT